MTSPIIVLNTFLVSTAIVFQLYTASDLYAEPYIPKKDSVVLAQLPALSNPYIRKLRKLRSQLLKNPRDLTRAVDLARAYLQLGRTNADPRYDGYAKSVLEPWWNLIQPPPEVLILRATLRQRGHDFEPALKDLVRILESQPQHAQAWLTKAVIHQVQGNYQEARRSCLQLIRLASTLVSTSCMANVANLNGQLAESYKSLKRVVLSHSKAPPQEKLWAFTLLAEMASRLNKISETEYYFHQALAIDSEDTYLLGTYSDFLFDQNRPAEVQALLQDNIRPDGLLLRLALAEQQLNAPTLVEHVTTLNMRFAENRLRKESRHLREESRFILHLLHQPKRALKLAKENWNIQREPWDARILLEAALQSDNRSAAQPVINWLTSNNVEDVQLKKLRGKLS